jgi:hypothetical protein
MIRINGRNFKLAPLELVDQQEKKLVYHKILDVNRKLSFHVFCFRFFYVTINHETIAKSEFAGGLKLRGFNLGAGTGESPILATVKLSG